MNQFDLRQLIVAFDHPIEIRISCTTKRWGAEVFSSETGKRLGRCRGETIEVAAAGALVRSDSSKIGGAE